MFHPMTGKKTKLKVHLYVQHSQTLWGTQVEVLCRPSEFSIGLIYCDDINDITCLKCMDIVTRPRKEPDAGLYFIQGATD